MIWIPLNTSNCIICVTLFLDVSFAYAVNVWFPIVKLYKIGLKYIVEFPLSTEKETISKLISNADIFIKSNDLLYLPVWKGCFMNKLGASLSITIGEQLYVVGQNPKDGLIPSKTCRMIKESSIVILLSWLASILQNSSVTLDGDGTKPAAISVVKFTSTDSIIPFPSESPLIIGQVCAETIVVNRTNNNKLNTKISMFFPLISRITSNCQLSQKHKPCESQTP